MNSKQIVLWLWSLMQASLLFSQIDTLDERLYFDAKYVQVLADKQYDINRIVSDSSLTFLDSAQLSDFQRNQSYWLKCNLYNASAYSQVYHLRSLPLLDFTLYYYDKDKQKWVAQTGGLASPYPARRPGVLPCPFPPQQVSTIYIHTRLARLAPSPYATFYNLYFEKAEFYQEKDQKMWILWLATLAVMAVFFLYNLYLYFLFKDITYLYYLMIVVGGIIYLTALNKFFNVLFAFRLFQVEMVSNGDIYYSDVNNGFTQLGIIFIMTGFIQLTRNYLQMQYLLPKWDKFLQLINAIFVGVIAFSTFLTLSGIFYSETLTVRAQNLSNVGIILLLFYLGFLAHRKDFKPAKFFLLANAFPLLVIILIAGYFAIYRFYGKGAIYLPSLAIISHTLTFAVALVARVNLLKEELQQRQLEAEHLQNENEQITMRSKMIELENEFMNAEIALEKEKSQYLQEKLEFNQRELASITLHIYQKNEMLTDLQKQIKELPQTPVHQKSLKLIQETIQRNLYLEADWEKFRLHFEQVHPDFFKQLLEKCPNLTPYEIRLSAYLHLQLSTKEIASLLNISPSSVLTAKMRLKKKMNPEENN